MRHRKGAATAAVRLSSPSPSHPLSRRGRLPQFHPRGPIFIDHPRRHRSVHFLFSRALHPRSLRKKRKKNSHRPSVASPRQLAAVLFYARFFSREGGFFSRDSPRATKTHPVTLYSWELMSRSYVARECVDRSKGEFDETWKHNICVARDSSER